jgi:lysozyme
MTATPYRTTRRPARTPSKNCERFLHAQEGLARRIPGDPTRVRAYQCPGGVWTIGYGNTAYEDGTPVREGDVITVERAQALFRDRLAKVYVPAVLRALDDRGIVVDQSELDALVSLCYNIGPGSPTSRRGFYNSSVVRALARGDREGAATAFLDYRFAAGQELRGLRRRRELEAQMFLFGPDDEGGMFDSAPFVEQQQTAEGVATSRPVMTRTEAAIAVPAAAGAAGTVAQAAGPVAEAAGAVVEKMQEVGHTLLGLSGLLPSLGTIGAVLIVGAVAYGIWATIRARRAEAKLNAVQAAQEQVSDVNAEPVEDEATPPRAAKRAAPTRGRRRSRA